MQLYNKLCADRTGAGTLRSLSDYVFVLEQQVHCVVATDLASHIVRWNKAAEVQFWLQQRFHVRTHADLSMLPSAISPWPTICSSLPASADIGRAEVKLLSKDGRECYQTRTVAPLYDRSGALIGGFGTGIPAT